MSTKAISIRSGWLRDQKFDLVLILGVTVLALAGGFFSLDSEKLFIAILILNLWLLGYHHVISTFTRIAFDKISFSENKLLVLSLPLLVLPLTFAAAYSFGAWTVTTLYLYWQWFHYTRQSYGIARAYWHKGDNAKSLNIRLEELATYALPLLGILYRSYQSPDQFLFSDAWTLPINLLTIQALAGTTAIIILMQIFGWLKAWQKKELSLAYLLYMLSHHVIFLTAYILIADINYGWLVLNIWHNAQYILFVWMQNNTRFKDGIDPQRKFISTISQKDKLITYLVVSFILSTIIYKGLDLLVTQVEASSVLSLTIIVYGAINFHHYIVDGIIWRRKN